MAAGADLSRVSIFQMGSKDEPVPFRVPQDAAELGRRVAEKRAALVVIDPLMEFIDGKVDSPQVAPGPPGGRGAQPDRPRARLRGPGDLPLEQGRLDRPAAAPRGLGRVHPGGAWRADARPRPRRPGRRGRAASGCWRCRRRTWRRSRRRSSTGSTPRAWWATRARRSSPPKIVCIGESAAGAHDLLRGQPDEEEQTGTDEAEALLAASSPMVQSPQRRSPSRRVDSACPTSSSGALAPGSVWSPPRRGSRAAGSGRCRRRPYEGAPPRLHARGILGAFVILSGFPAPPKAPKAPKAPCP